MRHYELAMLAAFGCAPAVGSPPPVAIAIEPSLPAPLAETRRIDATLPADVYLEGPLPEPRRMAKLAYVGALYGSEPAPDVAPLTPPAEPRREAAYPQRFVVVEERANSVRAVIEDRGVRLVAYLLRSDLHPVVRKRTRLSLGVREVPPDTRVGAE